jgi:calcineurin-like phosphoesterase family protein
MNKELIKRWNNTVKKTDRVFHLGDFCLGLKENIELARLLNGKKILIKGNHDRTNNQIYLDNGFAEVYNFPIVYNPRLYGRKIYSFS